MLAVISGKILNQGTTFNKSKNVDIPWVDVYDGVSSVRVHGLVASGSTFGEDISLEVDVYAIDKDKLYLKYHH